MFWVYFKLGQDPFRVDLNRIKLRKVPTMGVAAKELAENHNFLLGC